MPDWPGLVRARLGPLGLDPQREAEIVAELADHLQDLYEDFRRQGFVEPEAIELTFARVSDWADLRCQIHRANGEEASMNYRVRCFWLPGLCALAIYYWLPHILFQLGFRASEAALRQGKVLAGMWAPWLLALVAIGASAAYWSRRTGGRLREQVLAPLLPVALLWVLLLMSFVVGLFSHHGIEASRFATLVVNYLAPSTAALLLGALLVRLHDRWFPRLNLAPHSPKKM